MSLKGMGESFLLPKDEPLTPNIDKAIWVWIFERRAQNTKLAKFRLLDSGFIFCQT